MRIHLIGSPGAGKTTIGALLSASLKYKFIELDVLYWQNNWQRLPDSLFQAKFRSAIAQSDSWLVAGTYPQVADIVFEEADAVVFLAVPKSTAFFRVLKRSVINAICRKELWNGNRETLGRLLSADSMPMYTLRTHNHFDQMRQSMRARCETHSKAYVEADGRMAPVDVVGFLQSVVGT